jgi:hypothetical protein
MSDGSVKMYLVTVLPIIHELAAVGEPIRATAFSLSTIPLERFPSWRRVAHLEFPFRNMLSRFQGGLLTTWPRTCVGLNPSARGQSTPEARGGRPGAFACGLLSRPFVEEDVMTRDPSAVVAGALPFATPLLRGLAQAALSTPLSTSARSPWWRWCSSMFQLKLRSSRCVMSAWSLRAGLLGPGSMQLSQSPRERLDHLSWHHGPGTGRRRSRGRAHPSRYPRCRQHATLLEGCDPASHGPSHAAAALHRSSLPPVGVHHCRCALHSRLVTAPLSNPRQPSDFHLQAWQVSGLSPPVSRSVPRLTKLSLSAETVPIRIEKRSLNGSWPSPRAGPRMLSSYLPPSPRLALTRGTTTHTLSPHGPHTGPNSGCRPLAERAYAPHSVAHHGGRVPAWTLQGADVGVC